MSSARALNNSRSFSSANSSSSLSSSASSSTPTWEVAWAAVVVCLHFPPCRAHLILSPIPHSFPQSYDELRTVRGAVAPTFRAACGQLGLLYDDGEFYQAMADVVTHGTSRRIRSLFVRILQSCSIGSIRQLWDTFADDMSDDFAFRRRGSANTTTLLCDHQRVSSCSCDTRFVSSTVCKPHHYHVIIHYSHCASSRNS